MNMIFSPRAIALPFLIFLASIFGVPALWARDVPTCSIEDDSSLRRSLEAFWFRETPGSVLARPAEIHTLRSGSRV
ncbi:MAG: hypothetical protein FWC65_02570, partial [Treponema sp.]|nr:hypothetical protein [Treponema sp.]